MTLNKLEFGGIALSVLAMAGALWFLQLDSGSEVVASNSGSNSAAVGSVVVNAEGNQQAALATALIEAASTDGNLERLVIDDITYGTGEAAAQGDSVAVHYIGRLQDGTEFDSSYKRGEPFTFTIGEGRVIAGWEEGLKGMQVGGERILVIPSELGYGERGFGPIPGGAALVFAIELLQIN